MPEQTNHIPLIIRLIEQGRFDEAEGHCLSLMQESDDPEILYLMAVIRGNKEDYETSTGLFEKAIQGLPDRADVFHNYGVLCQKAGNLEQALRLWRKTIRIDPSRVDTYYNLGKGLSELKHCQEAEAIYQSVLCLSPNNPEVLYNLGNLRFRVDDFKSAEQFFRNAIEVLPEWDAPWINLGMALKNMNQLDEAEECCRKAIRLNPGSVEAHWNLSHLFFLQEMWEEGFCEHEWRLKRSESPAIDWGRPRWDGSFQPESRILLWAEQGVGDAIQFLRYVKIVSEKLAEIIVYCHPSLVHLVNSMPEVKKAYAFGSLLPRFDIHAPLLSLPYLCDVSEPSESWPGPYLLINSALPVHSDEGKRRVGLVWAGNPEHENDRNRSCPFSEFLPLFRIRGIVFYSFQVGPTVADIEQKKSGLNITDLSPGLTDFSKTADLINQMDLVISVDTAVAHLSGALGKCIWMIIPAIPDSRWSISGKKTDWYPDMRIYRQKVPGDWESVIRKVENDLICMQ